VDTDTIEWDLRSLTDLSLLSVHHTLRGWPRVKTSQRLTNARIDLSSTPSELISLLRESCALEWLVYESSEYPWLTHPHPEPRLSNLARDVRQSMQEAIQNGAGAPLVHMQCGGVVFDDEIVVRAMADKWEKLEYLKLKIEHSYLIWYLLRRLPKLEQADFTSNEVVENTAMETDAAGEGKEERKLVLPSLTSLKVTGFVDVGVGLEAPNLKEVKMCPGSGAINPLVRFLAQLPALRMVHVRFGNQAVFEEAGEQTLNVRSIICGGNEERCVRFWLRCPRAEFLRVDITDQKSSSSWGWSPSLRRLVMHGEKKSSPRLTPSEWHKLVHNLPRSVVNLRLPHWIDEALQRELETIAASQGREVHFGRIYLGEDADDTWVI
jgi:hypothetical protein